MADNDNRSEDTSDGKAKAAKPNHDAFDRVDVSEQPGQSPRNRVNSGDFGFVSEELAWPEDPNEPGVSTVPETKAEDQS